ncbi:MAG: EAL domain-containing protein, partial [Pseudomonadales bacterium]
DELGEGAFREDASFGEGGDHIYFLSSALRSAGDDAQIEIHFGFDERVVEQFIMSSYYRAGIFFAVYIVATLLLLVIIVRKVTLPIKRLRVFSQHIASGHMEKRIDIDSDFDEINGLVHDLEAMRCEMVKQTQVLERLSYRDELTRLPNRLVLNERLQQAVVIRHGSKRSFALLIIDLNRFKEVNDALGHHAGDLLLQEISLRMLGVIRVSDTVARLAGDEFAILLNGTTEEHVGTICNKVIELVKTPYQIEGQLVHIGASIGVACYPQHGDDAEDLLRRADIAMYHAKKNGLGFSVFAEQQDKNALRQMQLRSDFQNAIPRQELQVYYQSKVNLNNGQITGFEALVRWLHPQEGLISPDAFLPIAEQSGLINELTFYVLRQAAIDTIGWRNQGYDVNIAVNIAPKNLARIEFSQEVLDILEDTGLSPEYVELELTENDILDEPVQAIRILEQLHQQQVQIVVDDFGTGYSSLTYLKKLPISALKIDRSFVMEMEQDGDNAEIVKASIEMAHNIGLKVVAEGVETEKALLFLKSNHCDWGQGYFFSRPIPADQVVSLLESFNSVG